MSKKWTTEETDFLVDNFNKLSYREIGLHLSKTTHAVENKARRMRLCKKKLTEWKKDDIAYLKKNYMNMEYSEIADNLGKSVNAVSNKALSLKLKKVERYTEEDDQFLLKYYGRATMKKLCKRLGKSEYSIKKRIRLLEGTESAYVINGYYKTGDIAAITGVDTGTVARWIKRGELTGTRPSTYFYINPDSFWKFIKHNIHKCNVKNIDDQILLTCPEWYQGEINDRKRNYDKEIQFKKNWTTKEIALLRHYIHKGYDHNEIAKMLNRSYHSIHNKVNSLS